MTLAGLACTTILVTKKRFTPYSPRLRDAAEDIAQPMSRLLLRFRYASFEEKCQYGARLERVDDGIAVAAGRGVAGVEPALIIGAGLLYGILQIFRQIGRAH